MRYETKPTSRGNIGVSYISQAKADDQAQEMDASYCTRCTRCTGCTRCTDCTDCMGCMGCTRCTDCMGCMGCTRCTGCMGCMGCEYFINGALAKTTPAEAIARLDQVREIILDDAKRLNMGVWHEADGWQERTCAQEAICGTSHCLAGWLQVCAIDPELKNVSTALAGVIQAPIAAKMFFRDGDEVMAWLESREYVNEYAAA